jgi:hypothetical protein
MKFQFINEHKGQWPVRTLCRVRGVCMPSTAAATARRAFMRLCGRRDEASAADVWSA